MIVEVYVNPHGKIGDSIHEIYVDGKKWENVSQIGWEATAVGLAKVILTFDAQLRIIEVPSES